VDESLAEEIKAIIKRYPWYGLDRIHNRLRRGGRRSNRKAVHRILKRKGWTMTQRSRGKRPRVKGMTSITSKPNERWAIDTTHTMTDEGWSHITMVTDCCHRKIVGYRVLMSGKADVAEAALEDGLKRYRPFGLILRSDNGLVFGARSFCKLCRKWGVKQEYITPYTPEQNGLIERIFRSLKEGCLWLKQYRNMEELRKAVDNWVEYYNNERPHRALDMLSPSEWEAKLAA
jgi:putative transposase